jgi:hypothetical protein
MTIDEALGKIRNWYDDDMVGNLIVFRAPRSQNVDVIAEETIKLFEMDREAQELVRKLFSLFGSDKLEVAPDKNGYPDRIKVVRRV